MGAEEHGPPVTSSRTQIKHVRDVVSEDAVWRPDEWLFFSLGVATMTERL